MGVVRLSARDVRQIEEAQELLLSPLRYSNADDWRTAVNGACRSLLGADMASFLLRLPGHSVLLSSELPEGPMQGYDQAIEPFVTGLRVHQRACELRVANRSMLWGDAYARMRRSAYYNDFIVPFRAFDAIFASVGAANQVHGQLLLHHERPRGPRFGQRGMDILRLLFPAFASGVRTLRAVHASRERLGSVMDRLGVGVALLDSRARVLHANPTALGILEDSDAGPRVRRRLAQVCTALSGRTTLSPLQALPEAEVEGGHRISVTPADPSLAGPGTLMAIFEPLNPAEDGLREEALNLGLTPREADVAVLLCRRGTNAEIAAALGVSRHTVRRHTERVLMKLGVHSRRDVAHRMGLPVPPTAPGTGTPA